MSITLSQAKIAFIGAGSMSEAIIRGLIQTKVADPQHIYVMNRSDQDRLAYLRSGMACKPLLIPLPKKHTCAKRMSLCFA